MSIKTIYYGTKHLTLQSFNSLKSEINNQGIDSLMVHTDWSNYLAFAVSTDEGEIIEIFKSNDTYMLRNNMECNAEWQFPKGDIVLPYIRNCLDEVNFSDYKYEDE